MKLSKLHDSLHTGVQLCKNQCRNLLVRHAWMLPFILLIICFKLWIIHRMKPVQRCIILEPTANHIKGNYRCEELTYMDRRFPICTHDPTLDIVSKNIQVYEHDRVTELLTLLNGTDIGFIHIGASIGTYTVPLANFGHEVVAVEANPSSADILLASLARANVTENVLVLGTAISDDHTKLFMKIDNYNKGRMFMVPITECIKPLWYAPLGHKTEISRHYYCDTDSPLPTITLNELGKFTPFERAFIKMDTEVDEWRALKNANELFDEVEVQRVYMEWAYYARQDEFNPMLGRGVLDFFKRKGYAAWHITGTELDMEKWVEWPNDIVWIKHNITKQDTGTKPPRNRSMYMKAMDKFTKELHKKVLKRPGKTLV